MKSLITSIIILALSIGGWLFFLSYTHDSLHSMIDQIKDEVLVSVDNQEWDEARKSFEDVADRWHKHKKKYSLFLDNAAIIDTDFSIARAKGYMMTEETALATGELKCIVEQLGFLHANERITLDNVF